jgi:hypothetical protein
MERWQSMRGGQTMLSDNALICFADAEFKFSENVWSAHVFGQGLFRTKPQNNNASGSTRQDSPTACRSVSTLSLHSGCCGSYLVISAITSRCHQLETGGVCLEGMLVVAQLYIGEPHVAVNHAWGRRIEWILEVSIHGSSIHLFVIGA